MERDELTTPSEEEVFVYTPSWGRKIVMHLNEGVLKEYENMSMEWQEAITRSESLQNAALLGMSKRLLEAVQEFPEQELWW